MAFESVTKQEQQLKYLMRLFDCKVVTEDFILEVEKRPCIWDSRIEAYGNKTEKLNAWNDILKNSIPEFEAKPVAEQSVLVTVAQRRWKSIRSCYARELQKKKCLKSGSGKVKRKQYLYFEQLRFLETVSKKTANNMEDDISLDISDTSAETDLVGCEESEDDETPKSTKRKIDRNQDDELIEMLTKKIASKTDSAEEEKDEDRHFLLSLLSEIKKVPTDKKLKLRADIISLISIAQQPHIQQWPSHNYTLPPYPFQHSSHLFSLMHQQVPSQDPLQRFSSLQVLQNMPRIQPTSSTQSTESPTNSENEYVLSE